jgi:hypothetical protein
MTDDRSLERAARSWIEVGPTRAPDHAVEAALARIQTTPQERDWFPWRPTPMITPTRIAVAAVLGVLLLGGAIFTLGRQPLVGVPGPSPSPSPTASPTPTLSPEAIECQEGIPGCVGPLAAGVHGSQRFEPAFSYETPSQVVGEWHNDLDSPAIYEIDRGDPVDQYVLVWSDASIVDQSDQCSTNPDPDRGRTAADWIEFVTNHPGLDASDPMTIDFGAVTGQQVELAVAHDWTFSCPDHGSFYVGLLSQPIEGRPSEYGLPSSQRLLLTVVDVGDRTVVILSYGPREAAEFTARMGVIRDLIATFRFD